MSRYLARFSTKDGESDENILEFYFVTEERTADGLLRAARQELLNRNPGMDHLIMAIIEVASLVIVPAEM